MSARELQIGDEAVRFLYRVLTTLANQQVFFYWGDERLGKTIESVLFEDFLAGVGREAFNRIDQGSHNEASNKSYVSK